MSRTLNERRADHAQRGSPARSCSVPDGTARPLLLDDDVSLPPSWEAVAARIELRAAADAVRRAQRELRHWETMYDNCCSGDPNRYIAEIHAAEKRLEAAGAALSALARA